MNVFSIGDGNEYELTRENFLEKTHKGYPFFQDAKKYEKPFFAICPACNNPIQIINLYGNQYEEEHTKKRDMHGRHFIHNIDGLPKNNKKGYNNCPFHNPVAFGIIRVREDETINEEIKELVENNRKKISVDIKEITGFLFKNERIDNIIAEYLNARNYCYTHTNRFNIPYSILYTNRAINLFGQRISSSELGNRIQNAITDNSEYFMVKNNLIKKNVNKYVVINLLIIKHRISNSRQYMTIRVEEGYQQVNNVLFEEEIEMKQYLYTR